jgi:hypothetical protein
MPSSLKTRVETITRPDDLPQCQIVEKTLLSIPKGTLLPGTRQLASDIFAAIDTTKDGIVITSCLFEEDGYGKSYEEAWDDFISSLCDKYDSLERRAAVLSQSDLEVLRQLRVTISGS